MSTTTELKKQEIQTVGGVIIPAATKYVDPDNGSNSNSGDSYDDAWETLDYAIDWYNSVYKGSDIDVNIQLVAYDTEYLITKPIILNGSRLSITPYSKDAYDIYIHMDTSNFHGTSLFVLYNSYLYIENATLLIEEGLTTGLLLYNSVLYLYDSNVEYVNGGSGKYIVANNSHINIRGSSTVNFDTVGTTFELTKSTLDTRNVSIASAEGIPVYLRNSLLTSYNSLELSSNVYGLYATDSSVVNAENIHVTSYDIECPEGIKVDSGSKVFVISGGGGEETAPVYLEHCDYGVTVNNNSNFTAIALEASNIFDTLLNAYNGSSILIHNYVRLGENVDYIASPSASQEQYPEYSNVCSWIHAYVEDEEVPS